jgi:hypothetical protein
MLTILRFGPPRRYEIGEHTDKKDKQGAWNSLMLPRVVLNLLEPLKVVVGLTQGVKHNVRVEK